MEVEPSLSPLESSSFSAPLAPLPSFHAAPKPRRVLRPARHYLRVQLSFSPPLDSLTPLIFRSVLVDSIRSLFGVVGAGVYGVDLLSFSADTATGLVAIDAAAAVPVRAAWTLCGKTDSGRACHIRVLQSSAFLLSIAADSRRYQADLQST